ncbi:DUF6602 domain-containing protein [Leptospira sp. 'Mane']|uniref:DUF6602 domain-containing protein n=1 Tax=Leptospira sp. 'Mane' TaxID=3387407 RepID=UPI00398ACC52
MKTKEFYQSLAEEVYSLKERFRLITSDGTHYLTDGEIKEAIIRSKLRYFLPENIHVGRGFIITENSISPQIDILIYKNTSPIIFKENELVIIPKDEVIGIIEVKSKISDNNDFHESIKQLKKQASILQSRDEFLISNDFFIGLFIYENDMPNLLNQSNDHSINMLGNFPEINHLCIGKNIFIKRWQKENSNSFSVYEKKGEALGYFLFNAISILTKRQFNAEYNNLWFPSDGKEKYKKKEIPIS